MNELEAKACPFCGSDKWKLIKVRTAAKSDNGHSVYIKCRICHARGPKVTVGKEDNPEYETQAATEAWNKRI